MVDVDVPEVEVLLVVDEVPDVGVLEVLLVVDEVVVDEVPDVGVLEVLLDVEGLEVVVPELVDEVVGVERLVVGE